MSFNEVAFQTRLDALTTSQESIETLSMWMQHHRKHAPQAVAVWLSQLKSGTVGKRMKYIYLANDVLLQTHKQHHEYTQAFKHVLQEACTQLYQYAFIAKIASHCSIFGC
eukprot:m.167949 g.167949  ORF g.167949 m.167949 type:complete len:110 (-) comp16646_c0_seq9:24-353(-)